MPITRPTAAAIATTLVRVQKLLAALKQHAPRQHAAVDPSHYPVLFSLSASPRRVSGVAEMIHSDVSTVSRQVSHLVQHGLIVKIEDPDDGRAQLLTLSPTGQSVIEQLVRDRGVWFEQLLSGWSEQDARCFEAYLVRFGDDLERFKTSQATHKPDGAVNATSATSAVGLMTTVPTTRQEP